MLETVLCIEYQHVVLGDHIKLVMKKERVHTFLRACFAISIRAWGFRHGKFGEGNWFE